MLIVLTAEIAAGVWAYQNGDKLEAFVKLNFKHTISNEYSVIEPRTEIVDTIQEHFQCCGVDGPSDWSNTKYNKAKGGLLDLTITSNTKLAFSVPKSCCKNGTDDTVCSTARKVAITNISNVINKVVS
jgi:CD81 antigen